MSFKRLVLLSALTVMMGIGLVYSIREFTSSPQGTVGLAGGPNIFAIVSFPSASGFVTIVYPTSGTIEFVLLPDSIGQIAVSYSSLNDLTNMLGGSIPVSVWKVNLSTGSLGDGSGLNVTQSSLTWVSIHQVIINYTISSGGVDGLYVLGLPSTALSTIVNVGTQPYTGPLTWLNGIIA